MSQKSQNLEGQFSMHGTESTSGTIAYNFGQNVIEPGAHRLLIVP